METHHEPRIMERPSGPSGGLFYAPLTLVRAMLFALKGPHKGGWI